MLHYLDVMIGFVLTMLILSLAVTAFVQAVPVYMRELKGKSLHGGLTDMLVRILPGLESHAGVIVDHILRDPLLSPPVTGPKALYGSQRSLSGVVQREELVRLLLDFMAEDDQPKDTALQKAARAKLKDLLAELGLEDPKALLLEIRTHIAQLELEHPEWSSSQRASKAILAAFLAGPGKDFMAKLVGWFDQTIDRVEAAYTSGVRAWTVMFSFVLVLALHLDTFDLMARLNADSALREKVVASAIKSMESGSLKPSDSSDASESRNDAAKDEPPAPGDPSPDGSQPAAAGAQQVDPSQANDSASGNGASDGRDSIIANSKAIACANTHLKPAALNGSEAANAQDAKPKAESADQAGTSPIIIGLDGYANCMGLGEATELELVSWPHDLKAWWARWQPPGFALLLQLLGMSLSISLLSLGAPFWYATLANLIKLRSTISQKDEAARVERQTQQPGA